MNTYAQGNQQKSAGVAVHAQSESKSAFGVMNLVSRRVVSCLLSDQFRRVVAVHTVVGRCVLFLFLSHGWSASYAQDDIFATPKKQSTGTNPYPTATALFAATRSGAIPEALHSDDVKEERILESAVRKILVSEYGLNPERHTGVALESMVVVLLKNLTNYELNEHQQHDLDSYRSNQDMEFGSPDDKLNRPFNDSRAIFNKFAADYDRALKEYLATKKNADDQSEMAAAADRRQATAQAKQAEEERKQKQEAASASDASASAEEKIRSDAANEALEKAKATREQRLKDCLESHAYKLWKTALQVQQGEAMIAKAQRVLDHDDAVQRESGVTDLSARRAAGEQIVAGQDLVESTFENYKKLGGKAATPSEVIPGPDPAAQYR